MSGQSLAFMGSWFQNEARDDHATLLERADMTVEKLAKAIAQAEHIHSHFMSTAFASDNRLPVILPGASEQKFIRQSGGVPEAVIAKLGSNSIAKRKPEDRGAFLNHVRERHDAGEPLLFRLGSGPVKNVRHYGNNQTPDLAEYLMLTNLARTIGAVSTLYPFGVKVQIVPDDKRGRDANHWPAEYGRHYIAGLRNLIDRMGYSNWLGIEDGQDRLYRHYDVMGFHAAAEENLRRQQKAEPEAFNAKLEAAAEKASDNLVTCNATQPVKKSAAMDSAWRYMVALKAEELSGVFAPRDAFPLRYGHHSNSYQIYTMGPGLTKLPWQIALPPELVEEGHAARVLRPAPISPAKPRLAHLSMLTM